MNKMCVVELSITIKAEGRTLKRDYLSYQPVTLREDDPEIERCVKETIDEFKGEPEDIKIRALMVLR